MRGRGRLGIGLAAVFLMAAVFLAACTLDTQPVQSPTEPPPPTALTNVAFGDAALSAAVLHAGEGSGHWRDTLSRLEQSTTLGFTAHAIDGDEGIDLSGFGLVYLDESVLTSANAPAIRAAVEAFVQGGGYVLLPNGFYDFFAPDFIGALRFEKLGGCPTALTCPTVSPDLTPLQETVADFAALYPSFADYGELSAYDYGYGVVPSTATALVEWDGVALYTINDYGAGRVFFTNPLLPNLFAVTGFSLEARDERQVALSDATASFNRLLEGGFAAYCMREQNGYSVERVFGSYGSPAMSWELHFEELTGIIHNSAEIFGELCREYGQIPSYTLIRNTYWWFLRAESVTYLLGDGVGFSPDTYENAYSSGTHIAAGDVWLSLGRAENTVSYFLDPPEYNRTAYPAVADLDGDGLLDIVAGGADGYFYFFQGAGFTDRLHTAPAVALTDGDGAPIRVQSCAAPTLADLNGDGVPDLVTGSADGKVYWFSGGPGLTFEIEGLLCQLKLQGRTLPHVADLDGDGRPDAVVGSDAGELFVCYDVAQGGAYRAVQYTPPPDAGHWIAPFVTGTNTLAVGTFEGYVARWSLADGQVRHEGYLTGEATSYRGNNNLNFGNNCVPRFADLNGDGTDDLLAGLLEYGLAYPIDSPYFPYRAELEAVVAYLRDNDFYVGPHFYTHQYASAAREAEELAMQRAAMLSYGLTFDRVGTNHHTWYSSTHSPAQSLRSEWQAGVLWDSGFAPGGTAFAAPQVDAKNVVALPFFLTDGGARTLLVANCSTVLYTAAEWNALSAKYGMPISLYYHCDLAYRDTAASRRDIEKAEDFRRTYGYSFVSEDQMMLASAAALNLQVRLAAVDGGFTLDPMAAADDFSLYDPRYQAACGVKVTLRADVDPTALRTDAAVWRAEGRNLYLSLDGPTTLAFSPDPSPSRMARVNLPADITAGADGAVVAFADGGLMEVTVRGAASTATPGWTVTQDGGQTEFLKMGAAETLEIRYEGE